MTKDRNNQQRNPVTLPTRLLVLPDAHPWEALDARLANLSHRRSVLLVSARRPRDVARREFVAALGNLEHLFVLDVASDPLNATIRDPEHEATVPNVTMLELIAARAEKIVRTKAEGPATIVIDDVATFLLYNSFDALRQIGRLAASRNQPQNDQEYVIGPGFPSDLLELLSPGLDAVSHVGSDGEIRPLPPDAVVMSETKQLPQIEGESSPTRKPMPEN